MLVADAAAAAGTRTSAAAVGKSIYAVFAGPPPPAGRTKLTRAACQLAMVMVAAAEDDCPDNIAALGTCKSVSPSSFSVCTYMTQKCTTPRNDISSAKVQFNYLQVYIYIYTHP